MRHKLYYLWIKTYESIRTLNLNDIMFKNWILIRFRKVSHDVRKVRRMIRSKHYQQAIDYAQTKLSRKQFYPPLNLMKYTAHAYKHCGEFDKANELAERVLFNFGGITVRTLIQTIDEINHFDPTIKTIYQFQGGAENLGVCIHSTEHPLYFTKIIPYFKFHDNREVEFYSRIEHEFKPLKEFVPKFYASAKDSIHPLQYLTTHFIDKIDIGLERLTDLIEFDEVCRKIPYQSISFKQGSYQATNRLLHDPLLLFSMIQHLKGKVKHPLIQSIEPKAYNRVKECSRKINPKKHYCLLHNDLHHKNVFWDTTDNKLIVLDWNTYGWGLKGIDVIKFVSHFKLDFNWFKHIYLDKIDDENKQLLVFLLIYYKVQQNKDIQSEIDFFYLPAYQYLTQERE
ncbi:MAG: phosphotransferase [Erysipelotrichaceae bacterium]|nr:phosphotransferase [Erysipelotrichaceae bacterium]